MPSIKKDQIHQLLVRLIRFFIKAAQMQIPFLVSRSGLTQMGWNIAERIGITMLGRAVNRHYLLFTGKQRFIKSVAPIMLA